MPFPGGDDRPPRRVRRPRVERLPGAGMSDDGHELVFAYWAGTAVWVPALGCFGHGVFEVTGRSLGWCLDMIAVGLADLEDSAAVAGGSLNDGFLAAITGGPALLPRRACGPPGRGERRSADQI
jgi:hypothetical protein